MRKYWIGSTFSLGLASMSPIAPAQDIPSQPVLHGFDDLAFKNDYITPRGLLVTNKGLTIQILNGFVASAYQSANGPVNDIAFVAGVWNDLNPAHQNAPTWNEIDPFVGVNFNLHKDWIAGIQYVAFISPHGNFKLEHNIEFSLRYEDKMRWLSTISFNPYAKLFFTGVPPIFGAERTTLASFRPGSMRECRSNGFLNNTANGRSMPAFNTTT